MNTTEKEFLSDTEMLERIMKQLDVINEKLSTLSTRRNIPFGYIDTADLRSLLNISNETAKQWRRRGTLKSYIIHRKMYYKISDIEALLEQSRHDKSQEQGRVRRVSSF